MWLYATAQSGARFEPGRCLACFFFRILHVRFGRIRASGAYAYGGQVIVTVAEHAKVLEVPACQSDQFNGGHFRFTVLWLSAWFLSCGGLWTRGHSRACSLAGARHPRARVPASRQRCEEHLRVCSGCRGELCFKRLDAVEVHDFRLRAPASLWNDVLASRQGHREAGADAVRVAAALPGSREKAFVWCWKLTSFSFSSSEVFERPKRLVLVGQLADKAFALARSMDVSVQPVAPVLSCQEPSSSLCPSP